MGIKNLTEAEEKEFYRLVGKMNGKETDKEQDVKVRKPEYGDTITTWIGDEDDIKMWKLENGFFT